MFSDMSLGSHFCRDGREGRSLENFWLCEWEFSDDPETLNLKVRFLALIYFIQKWKGKDDLIAQGITKQDGHIICSKPKV